MYMRTREIPRKGKSRNKGIQVPWCLNIIQQSWKYLLWVTNQEGLTFEREGIVEIVGYFDVYCVGHHWVWYWEISRCGSEGDISGFFNIDLLDPHMSMMPWNSFTLNPLKCLLSVKRKSSPFYYLVHLIYNVLTWGDLPIHKELGIIHNLYMLCLHIVLYNYC